MSTVDDFQEYLGTEFDVDNLQPLGFRLPDGQYVCRLANISDEPSKAGKPMVKAEWEVIEGDHVGQVIYQYFSLVAKRSVKTGKIKCGGAAEMVEAFNAIGQPFPKGTSFPLVANAAMQLFASRFRAAVTPKVEIALLSKADRKDPTKIDQRPRVLGIPGLSGKVAGPAPTSALAGL